MMYVDASLIVSLFLPRPLRWVGKAIKQHVLGSYYRLFHVYIMGAMKFHAGYNKICLS